MSEKYFAETYERTLKKHQRKRIGVHGHCLDL